MLFLRPMWLVLIFMSLPVLASKKANKIIDEPKKFELLEGFISSYQDLKTGELYLAISKDQLDQNIIYFSRANNGVVATGFSQGRYLSQKIIRFTRHFKQVEVYLPNTKYTYDENSELYRAKGTNVDNGFIASLDIVDENQHVVVVKAKDLLLNERLVKIKRSKSLSKRSSSVELGKLDKHLTRVELVKSYPKNTDVHVRYTFINDAMKVTGSRDLSTSRSASISIQHSFIQLPNNDYEVRFADPRIGFFALEVENLNSKSYTPFEDVIKRWRLQKQDPDLVLSEPKTPITWWISNSTPQEYRHIIKQAVLKWNMPFESIGFKNAIDVKIQPDDASWDAGDIRYNVINWVASPTRPFGGYGPSLANPLTGEIIASDIMLEYAYITGRNRSAELFEQTQFLHDETDELCELSSFMSIDSSWADNSWTNISLTDTSLQDRTDNFDESKILRQGLTHLILHEVGHTLGLSHNMKSSQLYNATEVHNPTLTQQTGVTASVMDYTTINVAPLGVTQGDYYSEVPGPYDHWAIAYGYLDEKDLKVEQKKLQQLTQQSGLHQHQFGNDADDMRTVGRHIDPRVMTHDLTSEPVKYAKARLELINNKIESIVLTDLYDGKGYERLRVKFYALLSNYRQMIKSVSRYVGGVYIERSYFSDQESIPYQAVDMELQLNVLDFFERYVFSTEVLKEANVVAAYLQPYRRGFNGRGKNEDPKMYDEILRIQKVALDHLLHPVVLKRLNDSRFYGGELEAIKVLEKLTHSIFYKDRKGKISLQRQNLQIEYLQRLLKLIHSKKTSHTVKSAVHQQFNTILDVTKSSSGGSTTISHRGYIQYQVLQYLEVGQ